MTRDGGYTIYCCADATLTYAPYGSEDKPIRAALPVLWHVTAEEAERIIVMVGCKTYVDDDPYHAPPGTGPAARYRYSLPNFTHNDARTLINVKHTLELIHQGDARRAFEEALKR